MLKTVFRSTAFTVALFAIAAVLLGFGSVGVVQAAPRIQSQLYGAQVELVDIDTALVEVSGGADVERSGDDQLLTTMLKDNGDDQLKIGRKYNEVLKVKNTGTIDEYVRVTVRAYWLDKNTGKELDVDPSTIKLGFVEGNGWTIDKDASTKERTMLYYSDIVKVGDTTSEFVNSLTIDGSIVTAMTKGELDYEGLEFRIEAVADAVQTHNGTEAMTSAWGRTV